MGPAGVRAPFLSLRVIYIPNLSPLKSLESSEKLIVVSRWVVVVVMCKPILMFSNLNEGPNQIRSVS